jgi:hypothetical protein
MGLDQYLYARKFLMPNFRDPSKDRKENGIRISVIISAKNAVQNDRKV